MSYYTTRILLLHFVDTIKSLRIATGSQVENFACSRTHLIEMRLMGNIHFSVKFKVIFKNYFGNKFSKFRHIAQIYTFS